MMKRLLMIILFVAPSMFPQGSHPVTNFNINNVLYIDGVKYKTIAAAYAGLPSCTVAHQIGNTGIYSSMTWDHCGTIVVPSGSYTVSSQISIDSPFVRIRGSDPGSTIINYTGTTGCAISWTSNPFGDEWDGSGGLYDLRIDGYGASAGTCGLQTNDISAFHISGVVIQNFTGTGSIGWVDSTTTHYNEKFTVQISLKNNTTGWKIVAGSANGYTFGYGVFDVKIENQAGQTGLRMTSANSPILSYSVVNMSINQVSNPANAIGIQIDGTAGGFVSNIYAIEIESPQGIGTGHEMVLGFPGVFQGVGTLSQSAMSSNTLGGGPPASQAYLGPGSVQHFPVFSTTGRNTTDSGNPNTVLRLNPLAPGAIGDVIDVQAYPQSRYVTTTWPSASGILCAAGNPCSPTSVKLAPYTISGGKNNLPSASGNAGAMYQVIDETSDFSEGDTCSPSRSGVVALAFSNGSVWKCF